VSCAVVSSRPVLSSVVALSVQEFHARCARARHLTCSLHRQVVSRFSGDDKKAFVDCLTVRVSTSTRHDFPMVDLIDTPGMVDGEVNYPFDVNRIMIEMAEIADMILVFLDPMGQALCSRTMNVVDQLNVRGVCSTCIGRGRRSSFPPSLAPSLPLSLSLSLSHTHSLSHSFSHSHSLPEPFLHCWRGSAEVELPRQDAVLSKQGRHGEEAGRPHEGHRADHAELVVASEIDARVRNV
jgi:hypothetical protein